MNQDRRAFLAATGSAFAALLASGCVARSIAAPAGQSPYGALVADPAGLLDLPQGFAYRAIARLGDAMDDGLSLPDNADGMGCFDLGDGTIALVRNHELTARSQSGGMVASGYDRTIDGRVLQGGTTTQVLDARSLATVRHYRSLAGTIRNCAGGVTPWATWLSCEEDVTRAGRGVQRDHGWVFEVPAYADGLVDAAPLTAMGRFNHEAAAVDPATGMVYMTEDRDDGLLYRFIPDEPGNLARGGRLQALAARGLKDSRNWKDRPISAGRSREVRWVDLGEVDSPEDNLRRQGAAKGATLFARGEGIHLGVGREGIEFYICCTSGGAAGYGQIFRFVPGEDRLELFFESTSKNQFNYGDNLTVAANGHLIVCEDQYTKVQDNHLRGITHDSRAYPLARLHAQTELAGACFSPDGKVLFVNVYSPALTLAITGPWLD
jgi:secreted PhoX family phosphatase